MRAPSKTKSMEVQVGLFVLLGFMAMAAFSFRLTESPIFQRGIEVVTYLDDATGVFKQTKVRQAGISIGFVKAIELEKGKAKLTLVIEEGFEIPKDAKVVPRPMGILGDKYIEIEVPKTNYNNQGKSSQLNFLKSLPANFWNWVVTPVHAEEAPVIESTKEASAATPSGDGQDDSGDDDGPAVGVLAPVAPAAPAAKVRSGDVLRSGRSAGSVDELVRTAGDVSKDLKLTSAAIRKLVLNSNDQLQVLLKSWTRTSSKLEALLARVDTDRLSQDLEDLSKAAGKMSRTLENLESITSKIDRGEGTLGKLVNDPTTVDQLNRTLTYINHAVERSRRIETIVDMVADYQPTTKSTKTYLGLRVMTRETTGYLGQVVVDPKGTRQKKIYTRTVDGGATHVIETETNDRSALKYSVQFIKRIDDASFRLGLFESTGGVGADYYFFRDRLQITAELFDLGREDDRPHMRAFARVPFWNYFYVEAGGDELLTKVNSGDQRKSAMVGLGLRFTDDDIKTALLLGAF
ncbi:MAG: MCE family protein [Bdellovibrionales bacterium]|nr:MCE family protein [Bdellovibrionales bacterium]